jgi:hypothetical protein
MFENIIDALHVAPLALSVAAVASNKLKLIQNKATAALLFILSTVGILAGFASHHHEAIAFVDPCFAYSLVLLYAVKLAAFSSSKKVEAAN